MIREETDRVREGCEAKGITADLEAILALDEARRKTLVEVEELQRQRNVASKEIGQRKQAGEDATEAMNAVREIGDRIKALEEERKRIDDELREALMHVPNLPDDSVPRGATENDNVVAREWGEVPDFGVERKPHWELTEELGFVDFERGVKLTGSGFPVFRGAGARLERALINWFLDSAAEAGYLEILPPILVNEESARGTGQLPDKEDQMYTVPRDGFFLIPTSEVPVTNLHRDEILAADDLPIYYAGFTPNFRREAGSHGREVRGLSRVHQFHKVELVKFVEPSTSDDELESMVTYAESLLQKLGLRYRVLLMCTGDMGFTQAKKYDLEVFAPGHEGWLEVSSCSNFRDYQARRMKVRYRPEEGKPQLVHTLNGSGLATPRVYIALIEQYQQADGTILVPEVLRPYVGTDVLEGVGS